MQKTMFLLLFVFLLFGYSFAGGKASGECAAYFNEGVKAQKGGHMDTAETSYKKTLLVEPAEIDYRKYIANNRGIMYAKQGDLDKAEKAFKEALSIDPQYKAAELNLGLIYEKRRSRCESLEYWSKIFDLDSLKPKNFVIEEEKEIAVKQ